MEIPRLFYDRGILFRSISEKEVLLWPAAQIPPLTGRSIQTITIRIRENSTAYSIRRHHSPVSVKKRYLSGSKDKQKRSITLLSRSVQTQLPAVCAERRTGQRKSVAGRTGLTVRYCVAAAGAWPCPAHHSCYHRPNCPR